ncbi:MAG: class I SAM-dependent methyltransferase [Cyanobacteria bacterium P01_F01_bin.42]
MPLSDNERKQIHQLIEEAGGESNPSGWFEPLYQQAQRNENGVPWASMAANPLLHEWLQQQPTVQQESRALVLGCGLGDDAEALAHAGYQVTAFDISETAIAWVQERFSSSTVIYEVGDLFNPKPKWRHQFDLVFECRNFQALPMGKREPGMRAIANCVAPQGKFLMITNYRGDSELQGGPPWALGEDELNAFLQEGLQEVHRQTFASAQSHLFPKLRVEYRRPA